VLYNQAYQRRAQDAPRARVVHGINAATMAALRGDLSTGAAHRRRECATCAQRDGPTSAAARAIGARPPRRAALILGDVRVGRAALRAGAGVARPRFGDVSSTRGRRAARAHLPSIASTWTRCCAIPPVVIFSGHMIDRADRRVPRFPRRSRPRCRDPSANASPRSRPLAAYGSAACGADLLCLEVAREIGLRDAHRAAVSARRLPRDQRRLRRRRLGRALRGALAAADSVTVDADISRAAARRVRLRELILTGLVRCARRPRPR
jgi:hypothetical protein